MADNITKISSNYDMIKIMQNIGTNYFGDDLSTQRIGMFGFTVESLANMFGAAILDASNRQREYNVYTANKRSTLLYEGSKLDINIDNATPAKMTAYLGILTSSLTLPHSKGGFGIADKNSADPNNPNYRLVIEKDMSINIADYEFMVENDILIEANYNKSTKNYVYSVQYLLEGDKDYTSYNGDKEYVIPRYTSAYPVTDKYIQSYVQNYGNISILLFKVDLVNLTKESKTQSIIKNDVISLTGLDFNYSNNLSHFNVYYRKNQSSPWTNIKTVPIYLSNDLYDEDVIFYEVYHDEKKIRLNITDFTPAYNSEIRIDMYSTMGAEVNNLLYSGNGSDIIITLNSLDERHAYTGLELNCKPISSATGAEDIPTMEELRAKVIRARATVNSIDTNYDLINYMESRDTTNDYIFIKKRNDIVERRYSCYMIPRLTNRDIIPSSTLDLTVADFELSNINSTHYNFEKVANNDRSPFFIQSGDKFIGSETDDEVSDTGRSVYTIDTIINNITDTTNLDDILVPNDGLYNSSDFSNNFTDLNMTGVTRATAYTSLYNYIKTKSEKKDAQYTNLYNTIDHTTHKFTGDNWRNILVPNNLQINSVYEFKDSHNPDDYVYDISSKKYINPDKNEYGSIALADSIYSKKLDNLNGTYCINMYTPYGLGSAYRYTAYNNLFTSIINSADNNPINSNLAIPIPSKNGLYEMYKVHVADETNERDELRFAKTRTINSEGTATNLYTDKTNPYKNNGWVSISNTYFDILSNISENPNIKYIDVKINNTNVSKINESTDMKKFVEVKTSSTDSIISIIVSKMDNDVYRVPVSVNYSYTDYPVFEIVSDTTGHSDAFTILNMNSNEYLVPSTEFGDLYSFKPLINITEHPEDDYSLHSSYNNEYCFFKSGINISDTGTKPGGGLMYGIYPGDFFALNTEDENVINYVTTRYRYFEPVKINNINDPSKKYKYFYLNTDNKSRSYILYKPTISINDFIIYNTTKIDTYSDSVNSNFGYFTESLNTDNLYSITQLYKRVETDKVNMGKYIYSNKKYIKDIGITNVKGIRYTTNNSGKKTSITIKSGTPFGSVIDIIRNSENYDSYLKILNIDKPNQFNKTDSSIFGYINGNGSFDPKVYYQYPLASIKDYYTNNKDYSKDGKLFCTKNSLIPIDRYDKMDNSDTDKFGISESKGIYLTKNNSRLEDYMKVYTSPYTIMYDIENQVASFFLTAIDKNINMNMNDEEITSPINFSINSINVYRNPISEYDKDDGTYTITIDLMSNGSIQNSVFSKDEETYINSENTANSIILKGFIHDKNGLLKGWFDFDYVGIVDTNLNIFRFTGEIKVTDNLSETYCTTMSNLYMINDLNRKDKSALTTTYNYNGTPSLYIPDPESENFLNLSISNLKIGIGCYIIDRTRDISTCTNVVTGKDMPLIDKAEYDKSKKLTVITDAVTDGENKYPVFVNKCKYTYDELNSDGSTISKEEEIIEKYILTNVYINNTDTLDIYTDMSNYVKSSVQFEEIKEIYSGIEYKEITSDKIDENLSKGTKVYIYDDSAKSYIEYDKAETYPEDTKYYICNAISDDNVNRNNILHFTNIPLVRYSQCLDKDIFSRITENIINAHNNLTSLSKNIVNNFSIDFKFFRTYGPCRYFKLEKSIIDDDGSLETSKEDLGNLDITITFNLLIKNNLNISDADVIAKLKVYIKERIEELNVNGRDTNENDYTIYISNIITDIESKFDDYVRSIELVSINGLDSSYRIIYYDSPNLTSMDYANNINGETIKEYVPEYINVPLNNININVRRS